MRQLLVALIIALCHEMAQAQGTNRVMSGYAAISGPHAFLWVARDAGLFEKNGLPEVPVEVSKGDVVLSVVVWATCP